MKGDIVRALVELITNADDAYGENNSGKIRIEVEHRRGKPWRVIVRDRARGMRKQRMIDAIGGLAGRTSGFESGERVRGNLGRGAKDVAAFGPVTFESICDNRHAAMTLEPDGSYDDPVERNATPEDRGALGIPRGCGTVVTIVVADNFRCPQHAKLLDTLAKHFQLRDINSDPRRELTLVDLNSGTSDGVRYGGPSLAQVFSGEGAVPGYAAATFELTIWRHDERYDNGTGNTGRPEGILVKGRRAIYENTLFGFEGNPHAHWFSGRLTCEYIDQLAVEYDDAEAGRIDHDPLNPIPIITRSRDGLEREHPFSKVLAAAVEPVLGKFIREEEERARQGDVRESAHLRRTLDALGRDLGRLVDADLREIDEDGIDGGRGGPEGEPAALRIIPERVTLYLGEDKTISVVVSREVGATQIELEPDPEGVVELIDGSTLPLSEHPRREELLIATVRLRPLIENEDTCLTVRCGELEAVAIAEVRPEREIVSPQPPEQLEWERSSYQIAHGKRRLLKLRAPVDVVNSQRTSTVHVGSSDPGIVVLGAGWELEFDEDELCFCGSIAVEGRVLGARAVLTATMGAASANAAVVVSQRDDEGGPRLTIKIEDSAQGRYRAFVEREGDRTVIKILAGHSAIKRYLGPGPDFPGQESVAARLAIAEIVSGEAARLVMEKKHRSPGELDGPAFYADHLAYMEKYLARCHKLMLADNELN
jgi:Histidine kinase-, DNA gyrase B-, and HSP90-like ATPase